MLNIDFDGNSIDITEKYNKALKLVLSAIISTSFTNILIRNDIEKIIIFKEKSEHIFDFNFFWDQFFCLDSFKHKYVQEDSFFVDLMEKYYLNLGREESNKEELNVLFGLAKDIIIDNFTYFYGYEIVSDFDHLSLLSRDIDFISSDITNILDATNHIKESSLYNKDEILALMSKSFSRTIASYIDSLFKEFIGTVFTNSHYYICESLLAQKNIIKESNQKIKTVIENTILGKRFYNILSDFFGIKKDNGIFLEFGEEFQILEMVINSRNEITHHYNADEKHYYLVMKYWSKCTEFLYKIYEEYNLEKNKGYQMQLQKTISMIAELANNEKFVLDTLIPLYSTLDN